MKSQLDITSSVARSPSPLSSRVGDDLVLFSAEQGMYYGAPLVGKRIWELMEEKVTIQSICDQLMHEFSVERDVCEREVLSFVRQLEAEALVVKR